jgi:hypothetical protein
MVSLPAPPWQAIAPRAADQPVGSGIAVDDVIQIVAGDIDRGAGDDVGIFDIGGHDVGPGRGQRQLDGVAAALGRLHHLVAGLGQHIGVARSGTR